MIVYSGSKADFMTEVEDDTIAYTIRDTIYKKIHRRTGTADITALSPIPHVRTEVYVQLLLLAMKRTKPLSWKLNVKEA